MAKASSPVRLDAELMEEAVRNGRLFNRSAAETIEYWASLGKHIHKYIDPEVMLEIQAGALQLELKSPVVERVSSNSVFQQIEEQRFSGRLNRLVNKDKPVYQASPSHPGLLEQLLPNGKVTRGRFRDGEFRPVKTGKYGKEYGKEDS